MSNEHTEEDMEAYNQRSNELCDKVQDLIQEGDTLDIVMEMVTFMAASTGLQLLRVTNLNREEFLDHLMSAIDSAMDELVKQENKEYIQ